MRTTFAQRMKAATIASSKAGSWYQWGATGPRQFDCSGLVVYAFRAARRPLPARTTWDFWRLGVRIPRAKLQRGDLVYTWSRSMGHMGIYLGHNRYVHAPGAGRRVQVATLPSGGGYIGAVRP
jgi:cell wall-associated NlpC family hydrolase